MSSVKNFVDNLISTKKVAIFSKTTCPYCKRAKDAFESFSLKSGVYHVEELDQRAENDVNDIQNYLQQLTGARSVPRVFINGKFFGGGDDTVKAKQDGSLEKKLQEIGVI